MKKIFILTGEPSGDLLASKVIANLKRTRPDIEFLSVGGEHLKDLGIESIFDIKEITYLGFTKVFLNLFKISKKINETVKKIINFQPDILFSVDSPDFTLRVSKKVKSIDSRIKTIHFVAPQVWVWRERRVVEMKKFLDHILLLFPFEKKYFEKENLKTTFVGHPLLQENTKSKVDISQIIKDNKKIFSIFPGSRLSEINILTPILFNFIKLMNKKYKDIFFVFHTTNDHLKKIQSLLIKVGFKNCGAISDKKIKSEILKSSMFAVSKSGTISLEICNAKVPSIIIYKINFINFMIMKFLVKVNFANIINIINNKEIIPELLQSECNAQEIFKSVKYFLKNPNFAKKQVDDCSRTLEQIRSKTSSSEEAAKILIKYLII